jgi:hypothetical protein
MSVSSFILTGQTRTVYDRRYVTVTETFLNETYVKDNSATVPQSAQINQKHKIIIQKSWFQLPSHMTLPYKGS